MRSFNNKKFKKMGFVIFGKKRIIFNVIFLPDREIKNLKNVNIHVLERPITFRNTQRRSSSEVLTVKNCIA